MLGKLKYMQMNCQCANLVPVKKEEEEEEEEEVDL